MTFRSPYTASVGLAACGRVDQSGDIYRHRLAWWL